MKDWIKWGLVGGVIGIIISTILRGLCSGIIESITGQDIMHTKLSILCGSTFSCTGPSCLLYFPLNLIITGILYGSIAVGLFHLYHGFKK